MTDKKCIQQILGCLIKHPQFLSEIDKYSLNVMDFSNKFEKYVFLAIKGLYEDGATVITAVDIDNYLNGNQAASTIFKNSNGIEYVQDIIEFSNIESFNYYYGKLKKINLLNDLQRQGIDTSEIYVEDLTNPKAEEVNAEFENLTTSDIINLIKKKIIKLETAYGTSEEVVTESVAEGIDDLIDNLEGEPEIGKAIQGMIYNQVIDGAQRGALTIRSGSSGLGKTRQAVGDACYLAYPMRYNQLSDKWEMIGGNEHILFIVTEQTFKQVRKMILAYLTGINESKFKYGHFSNKEWKIISQAKQIIKDYEKNFTLIKIPNPTIDLVKTMVRENVLTRDIGYVFYDYIFIGPALLSEFKGFSLRNDEVLLMFATALKDLAVELDVCMMTSTQVNAQADDNKNIRNEASLSGGRSTINKADNGAIMARPTPEELDAMSELVARFGAPNMVTDVFKVRSGEFSQVRIWSTVDLGTMRKEDLYITDARLEPLDNFFARAEYLVKDWSDETTLAIQKYIEQLNRKDE